MRDFDDLHDLVLSDNQGWGETHSVVMSSLGKDAVLEKALGKRVAVNLDSVTMLDFNSNKETATTNFLDKWGLHFLELGHKKFAHLF